MEKKTRTFGVKGFTCVTMGGGGRRERGTLGGGWWGGEIRSQ